MTVDTLSLAKELRAAELSSTQAEAIAAAIGRSVTEGAAGKSDLQQAKTELKSDLKHTKAELKSDLQHAKAELRTDLDALEHRLTAKIEAFRSSMALWFVATQLAVGGLIVALVKL